jgi:ectoine hydroxylase-related dioxygenase (phytanoyl-CoA dioxygenase family)
MENEGSTQWEVCHNQYREEDFIPAEVEVGDVIFMSMFTVHRTSLNGTNGRYRLAISSRLDNADEATFIKRGYPSAYLRSVHREQYLSGFPAKEQVEAVFQTSCIL